MAERKPKSDRFTIRYRAYGLLDTQWQIYAPPGHFGDCALAFYVPTFEMARIFVWRCLKDGVWHG